MIKLGLDKYLPSEHYRKDEAGEIERVVNYTEKDLKKAEADYEKAEAEHDHGKMKAIAMEIIKIKDFLSQKEK